MTDTPRLRGHSGSSLGPWPIGQIPDRVIYNLGRHLTRSLAVGREDITGNEFGDIFSDSIDGMHYDSPLGLADVAFNGSGWSVKTVKDTIPAKLKRVRLISGRNSPDYSFGITDPHTNLQATGKAVLSIWNSRLNAARSEHDDMRVTVLIRNMVSKEFVIFEEEVARYVPGDYIWRYNQRNNLQGHRKSDDKHCFTWQFHGGQFTVLHDVPGSAICFRINRNVPIIETGHVMSLIGYKNDWIKIG